ncbi:MAG: DUF481 domain-containing protein [Acidobacteriota bacterium]
MNRAVVASLLVLVGVARAANADVVVLKNGDRLSGTFQSVRGTSLTLLADGLGSLTIPLARVAGLSLDQEVTVVRSGQPALRGVLSLDPSGDWQLTDAGGSAQTIGVASVEVILPVERYQSIVDHQASVWQDWTGSVNLGYSVQHGDQQNHTFSSSVDARRERPPAPIFVPHARTNVHQSVLLARAAEAGASISSTTFSARVRQDILFTTGNFVFGIVQFDHVGTEGLSLRQTYGGGSGYDRSLTSRGTLSLLVGLTLSRERFSTGVDQQTAQLLTGEQIRLQITPRVRLDHSANVYPNLSVFGQYHFDVRAALDITLTDRFFLNTALMDLYLTNPSPGSRRNNFAVTTGITTAF